MTEKYYMITLLLKQTLIRPFVFTIKYLKSLGFDVNNTPFFQNSWYSCHIRAQNLPVNDRKSENKGKNLPANLPVNKTQRAILELLLENNRYTYDELAAKINKTRETVRINLRTLEEMKLLIRDGADKNGFWIVRI